MKKGIKFTELRFLADFAAFVYIYAHLFFTGSTAHLGPGLCFSVS
jgi:hypothetical protein